MLEELGMKNGYTAQQIVEYAYAKLLPLGKHLQREGFTTKGWKILVNIDGQEKLIDPSVVRFNDRHTFEEALLHALTKRDKTSRRSMTEYAKDNQKNLEEKNIPTLY